MDSIVIFCAKYLFLAVPLLYLFAIYQASHKHRKQLIIALGIALVAAAVLDKLAGKLYYDPRPFVSHNLKPLVKHAADNGFPSEHTLFSAAFGATLYLYRKRLGALILLVALIVGLARIAAHVHSPIDILGGIVIGAAAGYAGVWATKKYVK